MERRGLLLVLMTAVVSGVSIFLNKFAIAGINSSIFTFLKNSIVAVFLLSVLLLTVEYKKFMGLKRKDWLKLALVGLVGGSVPFLLFFRGLQLTTAANASFLQKTMFVFVMVLATVFLRERLNRWVALSAISILAGNALLLNIIPSMNLGAWLVLAATVLWAVENILSKYILKKLSGNIVAFGRMLFGSFFILVFLLATNQLPQIMTLSVLQWQWIFITSALLFGYVLCWYNGLKTVKVSTATSILLLGSVLTTFLSFAFDGIAITLSQAFGIVLLLAGLASLVGFVRVWDSTRILFENVRHRWT